MAINTQPREDLLRDARAYSRRLLWRVHFPEILVPEMPAGASKLAQSWHSMASRRPNDLPACARPFELEIFLGIRAGSGWSIYFGEDPVLQFNERGQLRRLYLAGSKYAAAGGKLEKLTRRQLGGRVRLERLLLEARISRAADDRVRRLSVRTAALPYPRRAGGGWTDSVG